MKTSQVPVENGSCFVRSCGQGQSLLLIHAGIADSSMWQPQFEEFCGSHHVIAPDLRGHGRSMLPPAPFSFNQDFIDIMDYFEVERSWVIGASYGSWLGANFTLEHPERVEGLILLTATLAGFEWDEDLLEYSQLEEELLAQGDISAATELNMATWFDGPERTADQVDQNLRARVAAMQQRTFEIPEPDGVELTDFRVENLDRYREIKCPIILILGELDQPAVTRHGAQIDQRLKQVRVERISGAAHMVSMEKPEETNRIIQSALAGG